jgi:hypothetical protein
MGRDFFKFVIDYGVDVGEAQGVRSGDGGLGFEASPT